MSQHALNCYLLQLYWTDRSFHIHSFKLKTCYQGCRVVHKTEEWKSILINLLKGLILNLEWESILLRTLLWLHYVSCWIKRSLLFHIWRRRPLDDITAFYLKFLDFFFFQQTTWNWAEWPRFLPTTTKKTQLFQKLFSKAGLAVPKVMIF